jgi:methylenetetrahydrofolate--tRNA-(uracil-5-)-methyltransferase
MIHIIGGGLAGSEAAWQAASLGVRVTIHEMRPVHPTAVHKTDRLAELVCSNSFRGDKLDNAVGLLKEEMRRLGSLVMRAADESRVPAGAALAVDRERFSEMVTAAIETHPLITLVREEVARLPSDASMFPLIVATGPLTSESLSADVAALVGAEHLYFYDAISPIVLAESIDMSKVFRASRWGRSLRSGTSDAGSGTRAGSRTRDSGPGIRDPSSGPRDFGLGTPGALPGEPGRGADDWGAAAESTASGPACAVDDGEGDYLNCPLTEAEYHAFYDALVAAESATVHDFDTEKFFEGCLPIEVMAHRGRDTLRFGPMKPVGLVDPRTGRIPYAAVQLRQDNLAGDHFSLVGFQTQIKWGEQARVLRMIPGLANAEFVRFGMVHRNTYINGPTVLRETWQTRARPDLLFAGQISGVEGYVESAASGLIAGRNAALLARDEQPVAPPRTTAIGALAYYVSHADPRTYQPTNITFGIMPPPEAPAGRRKLNRADRKLATSERALAALDAWMAGVQAGR